MHSHDSSPAADIAHHAPLLSLEISGVYDGMSAHQLEQDIDISHCLISGTSFRLHLVQRLFQCRLKALDSFLVISFHCSPSLYPYFSSAAHTVFLLMSA